MQFVKTIFAYTALYFAAEFQYRFRNWISATNSQYVNPAFGILGR